MLIDLKGNIKVIGQIYATVVPAKGWWLFSRSVANETESPWRHGRGLALRIAPYQAVSIGRWCPTSEEQPGYLPGEVPEWEEPSTEEIKEWGRLRSAESVSP